MDERCLFISKHPLSNVLATYKKYLYNLAHIHFILIAKMKGFYAPSRT